MLVLVPISSGQINILFDSAKEVGFANAPGAAMYAPK